MEDDAKAADLDRKDFIEGAYYLHNYCFSSIVLGELSIEHARRKFMSRFPEFPESILEPFLVKFELDSAGIKSERDAAREFLRDLPVKEKIWPEEKLIILIEAFEYAIEALKRIMKVSLDEEFPAIFSDLSQGDEAYERLKRRLAELEENELSFPKPEIFENTRLQEEASSAWGVISLIRLINNNPDDVFKQLFLFFHLGIEYDHLRTLNKNYIELRKNAYSSIKGSESVSKGRWDPLKEKKKMANKIAYELWSKGNTYLHTKMADYLHGNPDYPQLDGLTRNDILKAINQAAKDHGRLRGITGVKKKK